MEGQTEQKKMGNGLHWNCCFKPLLSCIAWVVAIVSAVGAWWQTRQGIEATSCYWNALVFAVIALYGHRSKMGSCRMKCGCGSPNCPACGGGKC